MYDPNEISVCNDRASYLQRTVRAKRLLARVWSQWDDQNAFHLLEGRNSPERVRARRAFKRRAKRQ